MSVKTGLHRYFRRRRRRCAITGERSSPRRRRSFLRGCQHFGKLRPCQEAGIDQIAFPQPFEGCVVGFKTMTLEHGLALPGQFEELQVTADPIDIFRPAPRVVYIVDPQQVAIAEM